MKDLYIIGAGGFGREVAWLVERINAAESAKGNDRVWDLKGFIDDDVSRHGKIEDGYPVLGGCDYLKKCSVNTETYAVCAVGSAKLRKSIVDKLSDSDVKYATLIDPSVLVSDRVRIGEGTIICAGTIITVDVMIGKHVIINLDCTLGHDDVLSDYVTVYPSANISGNVCVGACTELGTGMQVIQGRKIGNRTIVGAGTVVVKDLPDECTAVGSPAKIIRTEG